MTPEEERELYEKALKVLGVQSQLDMVIEECAELIVAIQHYKRNRCDGDAVAEEMGDVQNCLNQFSETFPFEEIRQAKMERLKTVLYREAKRG